MTVARTVVHFNFSMPGASAALLCAFGLKLYPVHALGVSNASQSTSLIFPWSLSYKGGIGKLKQHSLLGIEGLYLYDGFLEIIQPVAKVLMASWETSRPRPNY